jgi:hypothetical protein
MNAPLCINQVANSAKWNAVSAQPKKEKNTLEQMAKLDRWTVIAALSSVASAIYLILA